MEFFPGFLSRIRYYYDATRDNGGADRFSKCIYIYMYMYVEI